MSDDRIEIECDLTEDAFIRFKRDDGAVRFRRAYFLRLADRLPAASIFLHILTAIAMDFRAHVDREGVHDRRADAMETAGDLVAFAAEFTARMEDGEHRLKRRDFRLGMDLYGNTAAIIGDADAISWEKRDFDVVAVAAHRFIARVVENLPDKVVQPGRAGRTDVHARAAADRFQALQNSNISCSVGALFGFRFRHIFTSELYQIPGCFPTQLSPFRWLC